MADGTASKKCLNCYVFPTNKRLSNTACIPLLLCPTTGPCNTQQRVDQSPRLPGQPAESTHTCIGPLAFPTTGPVTSCPDIDASTDPGQATLMSRTHGIQSDSVPPCSCPLPLPSTKPSHPAPTSGHCNTQQRADHANRLLGQLVGSKHTYSSLHGPVTMDPQSRVKADGRTAALASNLNENGLLSCLLRSNRCTSWYASAEPEAVLSGPVVNPYEMSSPLPRGAEPGCLAGWTEHQEIKIGGEPAHAAHAGQALLLPLVSDFKDEWMLIADVGEENNLSEHASKFIPAAVEHCPQTAPIVAPHNWMCLIPPSEPCGGGDLLPGGRRNEWGWLVNCAMPLPLSSGPGWVLSRVERNKIMRVTHGNTKPISHQNGGAKKKAATNKPAAPHKAGVNGCLRNEFCIRVNKHPGKCNTNAGSAVAVRYCAWVGNHPATDGFVRTPRLVEIEGLEGMIRCTTDDLSKWGTGIKDVEQQKGRLVLGAPLPPLLSR
eukprot:gene8054-1440_t